MLCCFFQALISCFPCNIIPPLTDFLDDLSPAQSASERACKVLDGRDGIGGKTGSEVKGNPYIYWWHDGRGRSGTSCRVCTVVCPSGFPSAWCDDTGGRGRDRSHFGTFWTSGGFFDFPSSYPLEFGTLHCATENIVCDDDVMDSARLAIYSRTSRLQASPGRLFVPALLVMKERRCSATSRLLHLRGQALIGTSRSFAEVVAPRGEQDVTGTSRTVGLFNEGSGCDGWCTVAGWWTASRLSKCWSDDSACWIFVCAWRR